MAKHHKETGYKQIGFCYRPEGARFNFLVSVADIVWLLSCSILTTRLLIRKVVQFDGSYIGYCQDILGVFSAR